MHRNTDCRLPNELLLLVKDHIPLSDLRTHVCYFHTCRTVAAFYGDNSQQAEFWRRSCALAGIGWIRGDSSWKDIAFETIAKDGFCAHPHCGGTLLDWNARQVEDAMRTAVWDPEDGPYDMNYPDNDLEQWAAPGHPKPVFHRVFPFIKFKTQHLPPWFSDPYDAKFRVERRCQGYPRRALSLHPIVLRSLATFPSVRRLQFHGFTFAHEYKFSNILGITVNDVLRGFQFDLDRELSISELIQFLNPGGPFSELFAERPYANFVRDLERLSTLRGLWSETQWVNAEFFTGRGEGPVFLPTFIRLPIDDLPLDGDALDEYHC